MKLTRKLKASYYLLRSLLAESKKDYQAALTYSERAFRRGPSTSFMKARHAKLLMLNHRGAEASPIFQDLAAASPSTNPQDEYIRVYSGIVSAFLKSDLIEGDRLFAELQTIDCRPGRRLHFPWSDPPSAVHARSILKELGIGEADPLGFLDSRSGVHVLNAFEAWAKRDDSKALSAFAEAERLVPLTPHQKALKAGLLRQADKDREADKLYREILAELPTVMTEDEAYLRFYCDYYRPSENPDRTAALLAARELAPKTALANLLPMPGEDERIRADAVKERLRQGSWFVPVQRVEFVLRSNNESRE